VPSYLLTFTPPHPPHTLTHTHTHTHTHHTTHHTHHTHHTPTPLPPYPPNPLHHHRVLLLLGFAYSVVTLIVTILALVLDFTTYDYFDNLHKDCPNLDPGACYCDATESDFKTYFGTLESFDCDNPATRNEGMLIANFVFSFLCALQALVFVLALLGAVVRYFLCCECCGSAPRGSNGSNTAV
jgi:hypothetical protein